MRIVLMQLFPLGRFHGTPWRVNPFDDPYGEWPPSPWRFVRGVVARWYQWAREAPWQPPIEELDALVRALCSSRYAFYLPEGTARGKPLRQYFPTEFAWDPGVRRKAAMRTYKRSLAQDNYWCTPTTKEGAVWWFLEGEHWTEPLLSVLDRCLERMIYFGRAESFTRIRRVTDHVPTPNCVVQDVSGEEAVPVLVPEATATREDIERSTDDRENVSRSVPVGARVLYAVRPTRQRIRENASDRAGTIRATNLLQFAIGWNVPPNLRAVVRMTCRFREAVIRELLRLKTSGRYRSWNDAPEDVRERVSLFVGKDPAGRPLEGHRHAEFFVWWEDGFAKRLLVWRGSRAFDDDEQRAILRAAVREVSWSAPGPAVDAWKVKLLPLDRDTPRLPGFDCEPAETWESVSPYVPPRHYLRRGRPRSSETIEQQVQRELALRGFPGAKAVEVQELREPTWVVVHVPAAKAKSSRVQGHKRGYWLKLKFPVPVIGPLRLGHSSSLGLGLFKPSP